jgi:hypothetical protein
METTSEAAPVPPRHALEIVRLTPTAAVLLNEALARADAAAMAAVADSIRREDAAVEALADAIRQADTAEERARAAEERVRVLETELQLAARRASAD